MSRADRLAWGLTLGFAIICMVVGMTVKRAWGAELKLPNEITCGQTTCDGDISKFGRYSRAYYERRWKRMCKGGARYDAMREAFEAGKPNPC